MIKTRAALYVRVSTQEQAKEGYSISEQIDRLSKYADAHDWHITKIYTDAGYSGSSKERPALQDLISDVTQHQIDKVVVYKLDRLSRSQKDTLELIEDVFLKNNCDFESMTERFDTSTPFGKATVGILAVFAQLEREQIKERMTLGISARVKEGKWRGGKNVPFGYNYDPDLGKLIINEYQAMIVQSLFEEFTSGKTLYSIAENMLKKGYTLPNGKIEKRYLRYILRNKTYCGYMKYQGNWIKGLHEPIISEDTYEKAQKILDENQKRFQEAGYKSGSSAISTCLGGLLYCAQCGAKYGKCISGTKKYGYHYNYTCYSRHKKVKSMIKDPDCKNKIYKVEDLDRIIFDEIKKLAIDPEYMNLLRKEAHQTDNAQQIQAIDQHIRSINSQLSRIMDLYAIGTFDIDDLNKKAAQLTEQRNNLKTELAKLQENSGKITEDQVSILVQSFDDVLKHGSIQDKHEIIAQLINRIDIDGDNITIHWNFT